MNIIKKAITMNSRIIHVFIGWLISPLILLFVGTVAAQPTCSSYLHPFDTCSYAIQTRDVVFLGRVISVEETPM